MTAETDRRPWLLPLLAFLYLFPFPYFPAIHSPNEGTRLYQARALIDDGTFAINGPLQRYGPMNDMASFEGRYYPNKAPGISIIGALVYWVAKALTLFRPEAVSNEFLMYLLRATCCGLPTIWLLHVLRRRLLKWTGDSIATDLIIATYALGSLAYTYGLLYFSHQLTAVLLCGAWLLLEDAREHEKPLWRIGIAGFMAGLAVLVEYSAPIACLPLFLYVVWVFRERIKAGATFALASLPPQLTLLYYHTVSYGGPFKLGYEHNVNQTYQGFHNEGFFGVSLPTIGGFIYSFFDPVKGMFVFAPFLLLAPVGLYFLYHDKSKRRPAVLLLGLTFVYVYFTSAWTKWGWTVGPRHLAPFAAFLVIPAGVAFALARKQSAALEGVSLGLCLLSIVITSLATITYPHYPEEFHNGFFQLTLPLLRGGYLPRNLLTLLFGQGLGTWTWAFYFVPWLGLMAWMVAKATARMQSRAIALAVGVAFLGLLSLDTIEEPGGPQTLQFVMQSYRQ